MDEATLEQVIGSLALRNVGIQFRGDEQAMLILHGGERFADHIVGRAVLVLPVDGDARTAVLEVGG